MKRADALRQENQALARQNQELKNSVELHHSHLNNSMFSLVQSAFSQSSLASFDAIAYNNIYAPLTINHTLLTYMYKTHGVIQTAIDMPVLDALRGGLELQSAELSQDEIKELQRELEAGPLDAIGQALIWTRLYGGGGLIINTPQEASTPLRLDGFDTGGSEPWEIISPIFGTRLNYAEGRTQNRLKDIQLYAANRWELVAPNRYSDTYEFYGKKIHHSRVLTMAGKAAPYLVRWTLQNWGMSEVERMVEPFNAFARTQNVIYELLKEAKIDVFQFKNFTTQLATSKGTDLTIARVQLMNQVKNFQNAVVLDTDDKFEQKQITFAGLAEVMKQNMIGIASALRIPMTKLFGLSAAGFNSGEDDIENYNAMVESEVRQPMRPVIAQIIKLYCLKLFGSEAEITFSFKPLRVMSSLDEETIKTQKHARYVSLYQQGLLTPQETMELMQNEKLIPMETEVGRGGLPQQPLGQDQFEEEEKPGERSEEPNGKAKAAG